jgi:uncharacterized repeat protein (TIGR01451 family)
MKISNTCLRPHSRLALWCSALFAAFATALSASADGIGTNALRQIQALIQEKDSRTAAQLKLESQLLYALKLSRNQPLAAGITNLQFLPVPDANGKIEVDLTATVSTALLKFIVQSGGSVINNFPQFNAIRASVTLNLMEQLAARSDVRFIALGIKPDRDPGSATTEGDVTEKADQARAAFGVDGSGIKVGVLSDSVDHLAASQASGDLPPNVSVLAGQSGVPGSGEGTAMLEIIHDIAPGAQLFFASANGGVANFAQNILNLRAAGCDIIVDDIRYANEPVLQDGVVASAVNTVTTDGALYFASAGNSGNKAHGTSGTWEGDFVDGGAVAPPVNGRNGNIHSFGNTNYDTVTGFGGGVLLFWADPLGASTNDYDLFVLDDTGNNVLGASTTAQAGAQDPFEGLFGNLAPGLKVVVVKVSGDPRFLHIDSLRGRLEINTTGFARGHSAATNAFSTAAVDVATSFPNPFSGGAQNNVESFSSDGPRRMFFQQDGTPITPTNFTSTGGAVRQYPTIAASDGVMTSVPGFQPFFGTSAAAPHAAAICALLKSYNPNLSPNQVSNVIATSALDIEAPGLDITGGNGIFMAYEALLAAPPPPPTPRLLISTNFLSGGNGNGIIDYNECNDLIIVLTNIGKADASSVRATLSTTTPGVSVAIPTVDYSTIQVGKGGTNHTAFKISTAPTFVCGTPVDLSLVVKSDQSSITNQFRLRSGVSNAPVRFDNSTQVLIPDNNPSGTNSYIVVSNITSAISKVTVSLRIAHTFDSDLTIQLISPEGLTNTLAFQRGLSGQNYGLACSPDNVRTTFDDDAPTSIGSGAPPFIGSYTPEEPLSEFTFKSGTNINGVWALHVRDDFLFDTGAIQCWSLLFYANQCQDGGGECPGADLAVGMTAQPEPVVVGNNLTYTISVTNRGPSTAKNVVVSHLLPASVAFVSAVPSQGGYSVSGGVLSCNFGTIVPGGRATVVVTVLPAAAGTISSTATVSSNQSDPDSSNNSVTVVSHVNPPTSDLAVGLIAAPEPVVLGGSLVYSVTVTNNGPSSASGVTVTNVLPPSVIVLSSTISQGSISTVGNLVICNFATIPNGARATATINASPTAEGVFTTTAMVSGNQLDPINSNNSRTVVSTVGPAADLGVTISDNPHSVILRSNFTYSVTVVNNGPSLASGVSVNGSRPPGLVLVSSNATQGSITTTTNGFTWTVGTLTAGASAKAFFTNYSTVSGSLVANVAVTGSQNDPNSPNNTASVTTLISAPFVSIAAGTATLTSESLNPTNGAIDVGETVTTVLRLRNSGNVAATNVSATLLTTNFVTPVGNNFQTYPVLPPGANVDGKPFTFTTTGTNGQTVAATLQVQANGTTTNVLFFFTLSRSSTFSNTAFINIRDNTSALPYPSSLNVSGLTGVVGKATVTLSNSSHTFPQDIDVLLVGPHGQKTILMSGAGAPPLANANITFDDTFAAIPDGNSQITSGSYHPASYAGVTALPAPAPAGPYPAAMSVFNSVDPNGQWSLYAADHTTGDVGNIAGGWSLSLTIITPVNKLADLALTVVDSPDPCVAGGNLTYTFTITNRGPDTANNVIFTDVVPANFAVVSTSSNVTTSSGTISGSFGALPYGGIATVTVSGTPTGPAGTLTNTASSFANELDLNSANNTVSAFTTITNPVADIALTQVASTNVIVVGSNVVYTLTITNQGPGDALNLVVTDPAPPRVSLTSASSVNGSWFLLNGAITVTFTNTLHAGSSAVVTITGVANSVGLSTNLVTVATASTDLNLANNSAGAVIIIAAPAPNIVAAGAALVSENPGPPNGTIDPGETVGVAFSLRNVGVADTANLVATLQSTGGVTPVGSPQQSYGLLPHGGDPVARTFSFIANGSSGGTIVATLVLTDGPASLGSVTFSFSLPATAIYDNSTPIIIPDHGAAAPYPSVVTVSGRTGIVSNVRVTLNGLTHSFPRDVSALLVGPSGTNVLLMSHTGGGHAVNNLTLTFDDAAAGFLPIAGQITSGTFKPTSDGSVNFPSFAPVGPYNQALAALNQTAPNGDWSLYVFDDAPGDAGAINNGWSLQLTTKVGLPPPFLLTATTLDDQFVVRIAGDPGMSFTLQASTNLTSWIPVVTNTISADGTYGYSEPLALSPKGRYYRAVHQAP